jgi:hypothetical protein
MIRRWQATAMRARRYAMPRRRLIASRLMPLRLVWLGRRRAASFRARIVLHTRVSLGVSLHMHARHIHLAAPLTLASARTKATLEQWREALGHESRSPLAASPPVTPPVQVALVRTERIIRNHSRTHFSTVLRRERLTDRVLWPSAPRTVICPRRPHSDCVALSRFPPGSVACSAGLVGPTPLRKHVSRVQRSRVIRTTIGSMAVHRRRVPASGDAGIVALPTGIAPLRLEAPAHHVGDRRHTMPSRAFAVQQQPLAAAPVRAAPVDMAPIERIERTLRESLTLVAARTVERELARALRSGAPTIRRLRESIQSEMYDDIVFERERRGER